MPVQHPALLFTVLLAVVLLAPMAAERLRVPGVIGLVVGGALVGPGGIGLLERDGAVALLGSLGLLYLMFVAGVELDLDDFAAHRGHAVVFGVLTFAVPMALGVPAMLALGYGATLVPTYFDNIFSYKGDNKGLQGFLDAIVLVMETGFAVCAVVCMILNLLLPEEMEDSITATNETEDATRHEGAGIVTAADAPSKYEGDDIAPADGSSSGHNSIKGEKQV
jgi:Kef-type K+ transport system membrane component KefB